MAVDQVCVYAFTPNVPTPPFVNISRMSDGTYRIVLRGDQEADGMSPFTQIVLSRKEATELYRCLLRDLIKTEPVPLG